MPSLSRHTLIKAHQARTFNVGDAVDNRFEVMNQFGHMAKFLANGEVHVARLPNMHSHWLYHVGLSLVSNGSELVATQAELQEALSSRHLKCRSST